MSISAIRGETAPWDRISFQPGGRPLGWWGMTMFIVTEAMLFALLLFAYFYVRGQADQWPLGDVKEPELTMSGIRTVLLLGSSLPAHLALRAVTRGRTGRFVAWLSVTLALATVFFLGHLDEAHTMWERGEHPDVNAYLSAFWTVTNFHAFHLLVGMGMLVVALVRGLAGRYTPERHLGAELVVTYWHFVDVIWIFVYSSLYLSVVWAP